MTLSFEDFINCQRLVSRVNPLKVRLPIHYEIISITNISDVYFRIFPSEHSISEICEKR